LLDKNCKKKRERNRKLTKGKNAQEKGSYNGPKDDKEGYQPRDRGIVKAEREALTAEGKRPVERWIFRHKEKKEKTTEREGGEGPKRTFRVP